MSYWNGKPEDDFYSREFVCFEVLYPKTGSVASHLSETHRQRPSETRATAYVQSLSSFHYKGTV